MLQFSYFLRKFALNSNILNNSHTSKQTTLLKNRIWHRCFSVNFAKFLGTPFLQNTSRRTPPMAASETCKIIILAVRMQLDINPYLSNMPNLHPLLFQKHYSRNTNFAPDIQMLLLFWKIKSLCLKLYAVFVCFISSGRLFHNEGSRSSKMFKMNI